MNIVFHTLKEPMRNLLLAFAFALIAQSAVAQTHVTVEKGDISFNFPAAQDTAVNHFEGCFSQGAAPVACAPTATTFQAFPLSSKAADPANPGLNLYHAPVPNTLAPNKVGESTLLVARACTGTSVGAGCGGLSNASSFFLDLSSPSNLTETQKP